MRLSDDQKRLIRECVRQVDPDAEVRLFGSRVDDSARGGDIDILCLSDRIDRSDRRALRRDLSDRLGGQRVDLVVAADIRKPFVQLILPESRVLK